MTPGRHRLLARLRAHLADESGGAIVEIVFLGVLLMVPLVYLVATLSRLQAGAYAASAAAREGARLYVTAPDGDAAGARARAGVRMALGNFATEGRLAGVTCSADPCLTPDAAVTVRSEVTVELPLVPDILAGTVPTVVTVSSTHTEQVDRYREARP